MIDINQTAIGDIPCDWHIAPLSELSMRIGDGIHTTPKYTDNGSVFFINGNNLSNGLITTSQETKRVSNDEAKKHAREIGDRTILLSINGTIGNVALYNNEMVILGKSAAYINVNERIDKNYLFQLLQSNKIKSYFENELTGTTIKNLSLASIRSTPIPLPSTKAEQTAIATALNDADALITSWECLIAKKKAIKLGAMQELLKSKKGWENKKLREMGEFKNGINKSAEQFGFGYPFVNLLDVFGRNKIYTSNGLGLINSNDTERKTYNLKEGDVLFVRSSVKPEGVGLTCVVNKTLPDTVYSGFIIRYRDNQKLTKGFKGYCFHTAEFRSRLILSSTVSANTNINQEALKNLNISFPKSSDEQNHIAQILSDMDTEITILEQKSEKQKLIKQGMMQVLLTGKIRLK